MNWYLDGTFGTKIGFDCPAWRREVPVAEMASVVRRRGAKSPVYLAADVDMVENFL